MSFQDDTDRRRKSEHSHEDQESSPKGRRKRGSNAEIGNALRAAYRQAVSEDIPPEMLDLLGKLG